MEKGATEEGMIGWHHRLNGHEFEQIPGDGEGTGKLGVLQFTGLQRVRHNLATEQYKTSKHQPLRLQYFSKRNKSFFTFWDLMSIIFHNSRNIQKL